MGELGPDSGADVVVIGGGAAGHSAALAAASDGASVLLVEKADAPGGTTGRSGGSVWIPGNPWMRRREEPMAALPYLARTSFPHHFAERHPTLGLDPRDYELLVAFCRNCVPAIEFLASVGAVVPAERLAPGGAPLPPYPDYQSQLEQHDGAVGRTITTHDPESPHDPGETFVGAGGRALIRTMRRAAESLGVRTVTGCRVVDVVREAERVVGVVAATRAGEEVEVAARRGVVFATGGFLMDPDLREQLRGPVYGGSCAPTSTGDFVPIAARLGARFSNMPHAWWDQVVLEQALRSLPTDADVWYTFGDSAIQVNRHGVRVVNEKQPYNERGQVHFHWDPSEQEYPNALLFQIYDDTVATDSRSWHYRSNVPMPGEEAYWVISDDTLDGLAERIDARLAQLGDRIGGVRLAAGFAGRLAESIRRYDGYARNGVDPEFHRGESPIQVLVHGPGRPESPNPTMAPFSRTGRYHCIIVAAGALDTKGGPRIDATGAVLDISGSRIAGLYGAGNCIGSPFGQGYPGAGGSIGAAVTFGFLAGRSASRIDEGISSW